MQTIQYLIASWSIKAQGRADEINAVLPADLMENQDMLENVQHLPPLKTLGLAWESVCK